MNLRRAKISAGSVRRRRALTAGLAAAVCAVITIAGDAAAGERIGQAIVEGARAEAARGTPYVEQYIKLAYPGGDVPPDTGVCTDLVIRALRHAGIDLQRRVHEDRSAHPSAYPTHIWENKRPDSNIDHRRCQNLVVWFERHAETLPVRITGDTSDNSGAGASADAADDTRAGEGDAGDGWLPGDVVFYIREGASYPWHVAIVSDRRDADGMPYVIDSYPPYTSERHRLDAWPPIYRHFRVPASLAQADPGGALGSAGDPALIIFLRRRNRGHAPLGVDIDLQDIGAAADLAVLDAALPQACGPIDGRRVDVAAVCAQEA